MKKLLLTTAISSLLASSSALAITQPGSFYAGVAGGAMGFFSNEIEGVYNRKSEAENNAAKYEAELGGFAEVNIGYNITEQFRAGVTAQYHFTPKYKFTPSSDADKAARTEVVNEYSSIVALVEGAFDVYRTENMAVTLHAGVGVNYMSGKFIRAERKASGNVDDEGYVPAIAKQELETPSNIDLAARGGLELAFEMQPGMYVSIGGGYTHLNLTNLSKGKIEEADKDKKVLLTDKDVIHGAYGKIGFKFDL